MAWSLTRWMAWAWRPTSKRLRPAGRRKRPPAAPSLQRPLQSRWLLPRGAHLHRFCSLIGDHRKCGLDAVGIGVLDVGPAIGHGDVQANETCGTNGSSGPGPVRPSGSRHRTLRRRASGGGKSSIVLSSVPRRRERRRRVGTLPPHAHPGVKSQGAQFRWRDSTTPGAATLESLSKQQDPGDHRHAQSCRTPCLQKPSDSARKAPTTVPETPLQQTYSHAYSSAAWKWEWEGQREGTRIDREEGVAGNEERGRRTKGWWAEAERGREEEEWGGSEVQGEWKGQMDGQMEAETKGNEGRWDEEREGVGGTGRAAGDSEGRIGRRERKEGRGEWVGGRNWRERRRGRGRGWGREVVKREQRGSASGSLRDHHDEGPRAGPLA